MARMTVKSLAAAVGVSPATISNAYNHPDQLSAQLRERILATAAELGYPGPDAAGRTLRMGRAEAVGVLLCERLSYAFSDPFAIEFLTGLSEVVEQHRISIVLMPLSSPTDDVPADTSPEDDDVTAVRHANIDALAILSVPSDHPAAMVARARGIRLVTTDISSDPESSWVSWWVSIWPLWVIATSLCSSRPTNRQEVLDGFLTRPSSASSTTPPASRDCGTRFPAGS